MRSRTYLPFLIAYLIFAFLGVFTIATLTSEQSERAILDDKAAALHREGTILSSRFGESAFDEDMPRHTIEHDLSSYAAYLGASIWFIDQDGSIICSAGENYTASAPTAVTAFDASSYSAPSYQTGDFMGLLRRDVITVSSPITIGFRTRGYVLIHQPVNQALALRDRILRVTWLSFLIIFLISLIILGTYIIFVQRPLRKIMQAAREYAEGNLAYEIPIERNDEVGYLAASLNDMSDRLNEMEESQKKFIANVSHDFRSPLTSIKGYTEAIADGTIPRDQMEKYLRIIIFETERLTDLTEDLLTLSDFDLNGMSLTQTDFDINETIKTTAAAFEGSCIKKRVRIELLFADYSTLVHADRSRIQQVLYNLLDNAVKFSSDDSSIVVETTLTGGKVRISVKDSGIGIPRESIGKIWDRFYKTDASRGLDKKGTGLGLSIVKDIIQAHGETINVVSTEGVGSEFIFTLPLA